MSDLDKTVELDVPPKDVMDKGKGPAAWGRLTALNPAHDSIDLTDTGGPILFGRHSSCLPALKFKDKRISSKHGAIAFGPDAKPTLTDTSSNGVFVNGTRVGKGKSVSLQPGDQITLLEASVDAGKAANRAGFVAWMWSVPPVGRPSAGRSGLKRSRDDDDPAADEPGGTMALPAPSDDAPTAELVVGPPAKKARTDDGAGPSGPSTSGGDGGAAADDAFEDALTCHICTDILYKTVSLIPCLHNFCAACYSEWMARSDQCPECRAKVTEVRRNHALANMVDSYLKKHPDKARSEEERKEMDAKSKLSDESLRVKSRRRHDDSDGSDSYDSGDEDSDDSDGGRRRRRHDAWRPRCRECTTPAADGHQCAPDAVHLRCIACSSYYPDRAGAPVPLKCQICNNAYCGMYWRCNNAVFGAFKPLKEWEVGVLPQGILSRNRFEKSVLTNYLADKGISIQAMFRDCIASLDDGRFTTSMPGISSATAACRTCVNRVFSELVYPYRAAIPKADLPEAIAKRSNCWWGKNCRTQTKADHARRLNHICEQTRRR